MLGENNVKKAIAYIRFSSSSQQYGDSKRRQDRLIDEWISHNPGYELDEITYQDLGLSAYSGANASRGALADFIDAVEHGYIMRGTVLLVESLDRLSREKIGDATDRLKSILKCGIDVVTLTDHTRYTEESLDDPYSLIKAILIAQRANEESEIKSRRMRSAWQRKREDAEKTGKIITKSCPRWLKVSPGGDFFEPIPERVKSIVKIFKLRLKGHSLNGIVKILNDKKVETLTGEYGVWNPSTIEKLLGNKALIGTYVPSYQTMSKGVKDIPNYFPSVVPQKLFNDVQGIRLTPFGKDAVYDNPYLINIFRSLMECKKCGCSIIMSGIDKKGMGYYVCPMRRLHRCDTPAIRRDVVDGVLIGTLLFCLDWFQKNNNSSGNYVHLEKNLIEIQLKINRLIEALQIAPNVELLANKVRELNKELQAGEAKLRAMKSKGTPSNSSDISEMDLSERSNRERCRGYVLRRFEKIILDTSAGRCDVYIANGVKLLNFPLLKTLNKHSLISAIEYLDGDTLVL
ncbi:recombinase family protein [Erwinia rhapontici]|uniref:recombinase family protein n=1 Tax=Erwinia rhapontici TaxID=55212 RepID=UPI0018659BD3|nr:recombinase family protein [Erwinia rhapontici]MBP2157109.1 DNA invertase Pin-like site-specific DNA recombinase [Erwinia rhapontici]